MNTELKVASPLNGLAHRLVGSGVLEQAQAEKACLNANKKGKSLLTFLLNEQLADPLALAEAAAAEYGIPLIDINAFDLTVAPLSLVSEVLIEKHTALPLHLRGNQLFIGLRDPTDHEVIDEIQFSSGFHVEPILIPADRIESAIERALESTSPVFDDAVSFPRRNAEGLGLSLCTPNFLHTRIAQSVDQQSRESLSDRLTAFF